MLITDKMYKTAGANLQGGEKAQWEQTQIEFNNPQGCAIFFYWNIEFLSTIALISIKDNQSRINLQNKSSLIKLGLIICISTAKIVIDHLRFFKSALLEL